MSIFRYILIIFLLPITQVTLADEMPPLEVYGALPELSLMVLSPNGKKIAYRQTGQGKDFLMVYTLEDKKLIGSADLSEIKPSKLYFIDEKRLILVVRKNRKLFGFRGRHEVSTAYSYDLEKNKMVQLLTLGEEIYEGQTQLGKIVGLSSDGKNVYMPAWSAKNSYSLMKKSLNNRNVSRFKRGKKDVTDYFIDDKDQLIARELYNNQNNLHQIEARIDDKWQAIFSEKTDFPTKAFVGLTPDFSSLIMLDNNPKTGNVAYYTMQLKDGKISDPIFSRPDKSVERVLTDINRVVYGVRYSGFKPSYELFNKDTNTLIDSLIQAVPNNSLTLISHTPDWKKIVFLIEGESAKGDFLIYGDGKFSLVGSQRSKISSKQVQQIYSTEFKARDGLKIPLLLTLPSKELKSLPAILMPHGGPESYDKIGFDWMAQYFASRGFLVIQPQFRGSSGFGSEFVFKGRGQWGKGMQHDLTDAVKTLIKSGYVNPEKVCVIGASYGGYAALAGVTLTPDLYQCAISINGVADVNQMLADEKKDFGEDHWVLSYWRESVANGKVDKNYIETISPINQVSHVKAPILLIHGEYDKVVPFKQSQRMYDALKALGKHTVLVKLDKGDHYMSNGKNRMKALKAMDEFVKRSIGNY